MSRRRPARGQRGAASLFAVSCLALLLLLGCALAAVASLVRAHRSAQGAADLAALAAAVAVARGEAPCTAGGAVARANGARLVGCAVAGRQVTLEVEVAGPRWLGLHADPRARARAGPG